MKPLKEQEVQEKEPKKPRLGIGERALLGMKDAGEYLGLSEWTVRKKIYSGEWAGVKIGSRLFAERAELDRRIAENRTKEISE